MTICSYKLPGTLRRWRPMKPEQWKQMMKLIKQTWSKREKLAMKLLYFKTDFNICTNAGSLFISLLHSTGFCKLKYARNRKNNQKPKNIIQVIIYLRQNHTVTWIQHHDTGNEFLFSLIPAFLTLPPWRLGRPCQKFILVDYTTTHNSQLAQ